MKPDISPLAEPFEFTGPSNPVLQVILIHGFTASPTEVKPVGEYLFKKSHEKFVIRSILLPGHGMTGPDGYKYMDKVTFKDWKDHVEKEIISFTSTYDCPVVIIGLSMGAVLTIQFLQSDIGQQEKYLAGILLSPALVLSSSIFPLVKYLKYIKKYHYKGQESELFFQQHNLFSYPIRSLKATDELRKLLNETNPIVDKVTQPILSFLGEQDRTVNVQKTIKVLQKNPNIKTVLLPQMSHIFTVHPDIEPVFQEMYEWIISLLEK